MSKKPLEIDMIAGSQLRDTQGETLDIEGADISDLNAGRGRLNDNHGIGFFNSIGRVTSAKKIFKVEDCCDERQRYYWEKVKAPYIYVRGVLYDDDDHPNAKAAAAVLRNVHRADIPLKMKASVEGGVLSRGVVDPSLLARTKIHSLALTFTPANQATLVEPINLDKSDTSSDDDILIQSVLHLAKTDVPSFRHITRHASAEKIAANVDKVIELSNKLGLDAALPTPSSELMIKSVVAHKIASNVGKITKLIKALTAGYGGASSPANRSGGAVLQSEAVSAGRGFQYICCDKCGDEQVYQKYQAKCRKCGQNFSLNKLYKMISSWK